MAKQAPTLPTELWIRVLENHRTEQTLPELWNTIRHVSTTFKEAVEAIFRDNLLPKTYIRFRLGETYSDETGRTLLDGTFEFEQLSEDETTAVFKLDPGDEKFHDIQRSRLRQYAECMDFEEPQHTVQVRHEMTDGPIPAASFDYDKFQLSCNWRDLYTAFWGEIQLTQSLDNDWVKNQEGWLEGLRGQMSRGELDMEAMLKQAFMGFASSNNDNLRKARRSRIKRQYKERDGIDWDENNEDYVKQEPRILKALAQERQLLSQVEFSDDEMEDEEDVSSAEEQSASEDEWEDDEDDVEEDEEIEQEHLHSG